MAIHRDLPESECHEPKGIISATTADAGKVITPSSTTNGEGTLRNLTREEVGLAAAYTDMTLTNNSTVISKTAATDSNLGTNTDYTQITLPFGFNTTKNITTGTSTFTIQTTGVYSIDFWANVKSSVNSTTVAFKFVVNGTDFVARRPKSRLPNVGDIGNVSGNGIHEFTAGDEVALYIASSTTANITIEDLSLNIDLIEAT